MPFFFTLSLWLHIVAFSVWLGGIAFFLIVVGPTANHLPTPLGIQLLDRARRSFEALSWAAIAILLLTGIVNLTLRGQAAEFELGRAYYGTLAIKFFLFLAMVFHHALQAFKYSPKIAGLAFQEAADSGPWPEPLRSHWAKWFLLLKINATLGPIVLLLGLGLTR